MGGWLAGEVGTKTNLSPARASLPGLSLAIVKHPDPEKLEDKLNLELLRKMVSWKN